MLDMKFVRDNPEKVMEAVRKRNGELNLDEFLALDKERRMSFWHWTRNAEKSPSRWKH